MFSISLGYCYTALGMIHPQDSLNILVVLISFHFIRRTLKLREGKEYCPGHTPGSAELG